MSTTPPEPPEGDFTPPPPDYGQAPQPGYGAPQAPYGAPAGAPGAAYGPGSPGNLLDRFLARLIDGVLFGIVYGILAAILGAILIGSTSINFQTGEVHQPSHILFNIVFSVLSTVIYLGYFVFMETSSGATVGKLLMKLKVVGPDGTSKPTMEQSIKRNIWLAAGILAILGTFGSLIGALLELAAIVVIAVGINSDVAKRQGWHDKFAGGTEVVKVG